VRYTLHLKGYKVWIFGSRARGTEGPRSYYDIGVLGASPLDLALFFELQDALDALPTLYSIDWVDLNRASQSLRDQALKEGRILYAA
jgi:predicted nucleotidyltransferase